MRNGKMIKSILTALMLIGGTAVLFLYTSGFRLNRDEEGVIDLSQTGMVGAKSIPEGANVYVDGVLRTATDGTVAGIEPGFHNLSIVKNGFITWNKRIEIFPELVTDITAILVSQTPRLEPLTNTGAREPTISPSLSKLAFFSKDSAAPGVWVIPLTGEALSLFRTNPYVVLEDVSSNFYSRGRSIEWSPEEDFILVEDESGAFYTVDLSSNTAIFTPNPNIIRKEWEEELLEKRTDFIERLDIPENLREIAVSTDTLWAPDEKKFLYTQQTNQTLEYRVYNMEKPLPIGEKVESVVFTLNISDPQPKVTWYADSFHLILVEGDIENEQKGQVSLIRIDGTNKTELFSNTLYSDRVFSSPGGEKIIVLTSFKSGDQTDLYTVGVR